MKKSIHVPAAAAALILSLAAGSLAQAQSGPTPQEQMTCRSDAGKFCAEHVGKPPQMNACLRANKASASSGQNHHRFLPTQRGVFVRRSGSNSAGAR